MGKIRATRHQKFLKSEKSKIKLKGQKDYGKAKSKGSKKELPKGTNVTDTTFKVKRIVVRTHERAAPGEAQSRGLGLRELLSRLQHHSTPQRVEALSGLRHLVVTIDQDHLHPGKLISAVAPLVLDLERTVRREAYQTLHIILAPLTSEMIAPFFDILCSYLRCSMTHINTSIHEDSLFYFDVLLECSPDLLAINLFKIFPTFIDMISKLQSDSKPGRTLTMNLGSKMTSVKWRTKVMLRLSQFLKVIIDMKIGNKVSNINDCNGLSISYLINSYYTSGSKIDKCTHVYSKNEKSNYSLHEPIILSKINLCKGRSVNKKEFDDKNDIHHYVDILIPLLFDAWLEVRPATTDQSNKTESTLSEEAMVILESILDIILIVFYLLQISDNDNRSSEFTQNFIMKYRKVFAQLIFHSFPYSQGVTKSKTADQSSKKEKYFALNLTICHIYINVHGKTLDNTHGDHVRRVVNFLKWSMDRIPSNYLPVQLQIIGIVTAMLKCNDWMENTAMTSLLDKFISVYKSDGDEPFKRHVFTLFCQIFLKNNTPHLQSISCFKTWLSDLPDMICKEKNISSKSFDVITRFAIQHNKLFNDCIKNKLISIMMNLPNINIVDVTDEFDAKKKIISLLYWVNCWDTESLNTLQDQLATNCYEINAKEYLIDILKLKTEGLYPVSQ